MRRIFLLSAGLLTACPDTLPGKSGPVGSTTETTDDGTGTDGGGTTDTQPPEDTADTADSGEPEDTAEPPPPDPIHATLRGTVEVQPYRWVSGVREAVPADELAAYGYPFGAVFVAAYNDPRGNGVEVYRGTTAISAPSFGPNAFEIAATLDEAGQVYVYASLDENGNTIIESAEPIGIFPSAVDIEDGAVIEDVTIQVVLDWDVWLATWGGGGGGMGGSGGGGTGGSGGSGGTGGSGGSGGSSGTGGSGSSGSGGVGCDLVITGDVVIHSAFTGRGLAMLQNTDGTGPTDWAWFDAVADGSESSATYTMTTCPDQGAKRLVGAFDSNENGLIDPADTNGAYVSSPGVNGNPITIANTDLVEHTLELPVLVESEDGTLVEDEDVDNGLALVPFVFLTGTITVDGGSFDDWDSGTSLYVTALKYRPQSSVSAASFASDAYDTEVFSWSDLTGQSSVSYSLLIPANTTVYLWAYADTDLDQVCNEVSEPVGNGGARPDGDLALGTSNVVEDFVMGVP